MNLKRFYFCFFVLICVFPMPGKAQIMFCTTSIRSIYEKLPPVVQSELELISKKESTHLFTRKIIPFKPFPLAIILKDQIIFDLGFYFGYLSSKNENDSLVSQFVQRKLLECSLLKTDEDLAFQLKISRLSFSTNERPEFEPTVAELDSLLAQLKFSTSSVINRNPERFILEWKNRQNYVRLKFPNDYQEIMGMNKKELDEEFLAEMIRLGAESSPDKKQIMEKEKKRRTTGIIKGEKYMNILSSETFYQAATDSVPVFSESNLNQSLANLFLLREVAGQRSLLLTQYLYGGRTMTYPVRLEKFSETFANKYSVFVGMENSDTNNVEGTVVLSCTYFNYIHLLHFKTSLNEIFSDQGKIVAKMYTNIPMNNVADLLKKLNPGTSNVKSLFHLNIGDPKL